MKESHCLQLRRVGPEHLLTTEPSRLTACKSVLWLHNTTFTTPADRGAATTWSSHSIGCRCRASRSQGEICSPESVWLTVQPGRLVAASRKTVRWLRGTPSVTAYHRPAASRWAAQTSHAEGWRGRARPLPAKPCLPEPSHATRYVGLMPLCCGGERKATDYHDMCDGMLYPRMTACEAAPKGLSRASPGCCNGPGGSVQSQPWHRAIPPGPAG